VQQEQCFQQQGWVQQGQAATVLHTINSIARAFIISMPLLQLLLMLLGKGGCDGCSCEAASCLL
jgi:hypothetical protein